MQSNYEADLNDACQLLGYDSYSHFCTTEKREMSEEDRSNPHKMQESWRWLLDKINMHPHLDFGRFIYPLIYARYGVQFRVCDTSDLYNKNVELHNIWTNNEPHLEQMSWLAHDPQGTNYLEDKMRDYLNQQTNIRFWDYTIASAYSVNTTVKSMNSGRIPTLYII